MTYRGEVKGGVVVLAPGADLPEGTVVAVQPLTEGRGADDALDRMEELATETGVADLATNVDHYLYGHPKDGDGH
jgi:hypothetical protein